MTEIDLSSVHPMDPAFQQDPFPYYAALRDRAPVYRHEGLGMFFVSRYENVFEVLHQPRLFSSAWGNSAGLPFVPGHEEEIAEIGKEGFPGVSTMLTADPPVQTRYRKSVGRAFSTRRVQSLEPGIRGIARDLVGRFPERGTVDLPRELTIPLPVRVIARLLSIPEEREPDVKRWSDDSVAALGVVIDPTRALEAARGIVEFQRFMAALIQERQEHPVDDFLSELADADFEDETGVVRKLGTPEMLSIVQQLMVAGNETTTKSLNEVLKLLVENPTEWKRIRQDPSIIPGMVEEGLRLSSPNQGLFRLATEDTELAGVPIPKGSMCWIMFGSANRDERTFPDPDRFDPSRENLREHLAFGRGAHFCIGAPLARLEMKVLFEELAKRVETMQLPPDFELEYEPSFILRGLRALTIEVTRTR